MTFDTTTGRKAAAAKIAGLGIAAAFVIAISGTPAIALADEATVADTGTASVVAVESVQSESPATTVTDEALVADVATVPTVEAQATATDTVLDTTAATSDGTATSGQAPVVTDTDTDQKAVASDGTATADGQDAAANTTDANTTDANTSDANSADIVANDGNTAQAKASTVVTAADDTDDDTTDDTSDTKSDDDNNSDTKDDDDDDPDTLKDAVNVYRVYNPYSGEHFYTANLNEAQNLFKIGWRWESTAFQASSSTGTAVYRLYNPNAGAHFYTTNMGESNYLRSLSWRLEGIGWYAFGDTALYRLYNPNSPIGEHLYTTSAHERDSVSQAGWRYEGIAYYVTPGYQTITGRWVVSSAYGTQERYWISSNTSLAKNRYIEPDEGTGYDVEAYATSTGAVVRNRTHVGSGLMIADNDGRLASIPKKTGWYVTSELDGEPQRYYITAVTKDASGNSVYGARTGWFTVSSSQYYGFYTLGYVARNTVLGKNSNTVYEADNDGKLTTINNYKSTGWKYANNVGSSTGWFISTDTNNFRCMVFRKLSSQDPWIMDKDYLCGSGGDTLMGHRVIRAKIARKDNGYEYESWGTAWAVDMSQGIDNRYQMFHSLIHFSSNGALSRWRTGLGHKDSNGCIRLEDDNAKYIYDNVPIGTSIWNY